MQSIDTHQLRFEIYQLVDAISPLDQLEKEHISFSKTWIQTGVEIFRITKPAVPDIHLVCYFVLIDQNTNQVLLTDHKKSGLWLPSGGHVEVNEHPAETVKRELLEELGIEADFLFKMPIFLTVTKTVGLTDVHTDVSFWYILKGNSSMLIDYDKGEFHQIEWFGLGDIPYNRTDPHMQRFMQKLVSLKALY